SRSGKIVPRRFGRVLQLVRGVPGCSGTCLQHEKTIPSASDEVLFFVKRAEVDMAPRFELAVVLV
ncbi:MAG: hypothetical protein AAGD38_08995, partial [Acidobacteriota bacterium]